MRKIQKYGIIGVLLAILLTTGIAYTQASVEPIIILNEGDLWQWDGSGKGLQQMTDWGYNQEPVLSPAGNYVAYLAWSPITVEALQRAGAVGGGEVPGDIKLFDVNSHQEIVIASQPVDASFFNQGVNDKAVIRSQPAWSPDGEALAWTEYDYPGDGINRVMIYDFETEAAAQVALDLPAQAGFPVPMDIAWGESGLVLRSTAVNPEDSTIFDDSFLVYDAEGSLRSTVPLVQDAQHFMTSFLLVLYVGKEYIGVHYNTGEWMLFDPITGESRPAPSAPETYCLTAPTQSMSATMIPDDDGQGVDYQLLDVDGNPVGSRIDMGVDYTGHMGLSPDGRAVAFVQYDPDKAGYESSVTIWNNGEISAKFEVNPTGFTFLWGPTGWRIREID